MTLVIKYFAIAFGIALVVVSGVLAVFAERRQDRNGPFVVLRSVTLN